MIYVDHAATTPISPAAQHAMLDCMLAHFANPSSAHPLGADAARTLLCTREALAEELHCSPKELYFTSGGSEADAQALLTAAQLGAAQGRRHLVLSQIEHPAVLRTAELLQQHGFSLSWAVPTEAGVVTAKAVEAALRPDTAAVSLMTANNETGALQPVAEVAALCRAHGVLFHTDAVQAAGHIPLDFSALGADFLTLSAHKFHGPRGVGALLARHGLAPFALIRGGGQERGARAGTENLPAIVGMQAAYTEAVRKMPENSRFVLGLRTQLSAALCQIPGARLTAASAHRLPGIVHVCFVGIEAETLLLLLGEAGICASVGSACAAGAMQPSHVLRSMGIPEALARGAMRFSLDASNTPEEMDAVARATAQAAARLRKEQL